LAHTGSIRESSRNQRASVLKSGGKYPSYGP
jgi:hypothetical protein